jgi:drug/metabolite transporter (DMT)-like permease
LDDFIRFYQYLRTFVIQNLGMGNLRYHFAAAATSAIWGTTLVSSKILLQAGMSPAEILLCRLVLAYIFLWILYPKTHRPKSLHDEVVFLLGGLLGGTIYFLAENSALVYTQATNVGLICATVPLVTALMSHFILKEKHLYFRFLAGTTVAFLGVLLVILNGRFVLKLNPLGDFLTLVAVLSWGAYCICLKFLKHPYSSLFITRKIFFYCILTLLPYFAFYPFQFPLHHLLKVEVWTNLLFLGVVASSLCFLVWTVAIKNIGVVATNNYIYFMPIVTILTAHIFIGEHITLFVVVGALLIIGGLWWSTTKSKKKPNG